MNQTSQLVAGLMLLVCSDTPWAQDTTVSGYIEDLSCDVGPYRVVLPNTVTALRKIGLLRKEMLVNTIEWGDNSKSYVREMQFDGLKIVILSDAKGQRYSLSQAVITSSKWSITPNYKVGDPISTALKRLGLKPTVVTDQLSFGGDVDSVSFKLRNGRISEIQIDCYTG